MSDETLHDESDCVECERRRRQAAIIGSVGGFLIGAGVALAVLKFTRR